MIKSRFEKCYFLKIHLELVLYFPNWSCKNLIWCVSVVGGQNSLSGGIISNVLSGPQGNPQINNILSTQGTISYFTRQLFSQIEPKIYKEGKPYLPYMSYFVLMLLNFRLDNSYICILIVLKCKMEASDNHCYTAIFCN